VLPTICSLYYVVSDFVELKLQIENPLVFDDFEKLKSINKNSASGGPVEMPGGVQFLFNSLTLAKW
jgi:hypothetical protein